MSKASKDQQAGQGTKTEQASVGTTVQPAGRLRKPRISLRWFLSSTVRHATAAWKHVHRIVCAQSDVLAPQAIQAVNGSLEELRAALSAGATKDALKKQVSALEVAANKWLKPYPNAAWRENVEVFLVAIAVAMGVRTFFLQPFKIPTGSMQPTLYGVTSDNLMATPDVQIPTGLERVREWFAGISYIDVKAKRDGRLDGVTEPWRLLIFNIRQTMFISGVPHTLWFPPDYGSANLPMRAGLVAGRSYHAGEQVVRLKVQAGDHLFVDRLTYNFRKPERGEIIVFATGGTPIVQQDQFYIKRLVALGNEKVQISNDRHLIIDGKRLDASTPHFENVYAFDPNKPPGESEFSGHVNGSYGMHLAKQFPDESTVFTVKNDHFMVMGDNTLNSSDSRTWGDFPAGNVIGKSFFVYWPITKRFGWGTK